MAIYEGCGQRQECLYERRLIAGTVDMLGSCLRALARGRLVAAGKEAQFQQLRFLNLHEYQVREIIYAEEDRHAGISAEPPSIVMKATISVVHQSGLALLWRLVTHMMIMQTSYAIF